jgi:hypothetical protein
MADFFCRNRTQNVPSVHPAGIRLATNATDAIADIARQYNALHPVAAGDVLEIVSAASFTPVVAGTTVTFSPTTSAPLPAVGT